MSASAVGVAQPAEVPLPRVYSRFLLAFLLTVASFAAVVALWGPGADKLLIVGMGWPHVLLGFVFYFNKVLKGEGARRSHFFLLIALTLAISLVHYWQPILTLILLYFAYHAYRDEIMMYYVRRSGGRPPGPAARSYWPVALLVVAVGIAQLVQLYYPPALRRVEIPAGRVAAGQPLEVRFAPVEVSAGEELYFWLAVPRRASARLRMPLRNSSAVGVLRVNDRIAPGELVFAQGSGSVRAAPPAVAGSSVVSGRSVGQIFRAEGDELASITLPVELAGELAPGAVLEFRLTRAFYAEYPYAFHFALLVLGLGLTLPVLAGHPRRLVARAPGVRFAFPALLLFVMVLFGAKYARDARVAEMTFLSFLVVFHYFSWYVFYLEKLSGRKPAAAGGVPSRSAEPRALDRLLAAISTRKGFLTAVAALNVISFAGAWAWQVREVHPALFYLFSFNAFVYPLVFHVTMSFAPKLAPRPASRPA